MVVEGEHDNVMTLETVTTHLPHGTRTRRTKVSLPGGPSVSNNQESQWPSPLPASMWPHGMPAAEGYDLDPDGDADPTSSDLNEVLNVFLWNLFIH